jgi:XTP/dITP diphosphohydrolase
MVLATGNRHKVAEIGAMLGDRIEVAGLGNFPGVVPDEETGETFEANAAIKAVSVSRQLAGFVLADDSGLEVDALDGAPGVRSARYAGAGATDAMNRDQLRAELGRLIEKRVRWLARFRCALALARAGRLLRSWSGAVEGAVILDERGGGGFGYDALFVPEGFGETFGELPPEVKNRLSHRARAVAAAKPFIEGLDPR